VREEEEEERGEERRGEERNGKRGEMFHLMTLRHSACFLPSFCSWNDPLVAVSGSLPRSTVYSTVVGRRGGMRQSHVLGSLRLRVRERVGVTEGASRCL
jgi:hypothetical protein